MKNILLPAIFVLFFTTSVSAQEQARAAAEINTSAKTLLATKAHLDDLVDNVIPALGNRKASLDSDATALKTDVADAKARQDAFGRDIADQEAAIERHNKNRCEAPVNDPKRCAAYNAETEALGQRSAALRRKQADLNAAAQDLRARSNQLDSDVRDWVAAAAKADTDYRDSLTLFDTTRGQLGDAAASYKICVDAHPELDDNGLKQICGEVDFDDVRVVITKLSVYKTSTSPSP